MITVKELIESLKNEHPERVIILAEDQEGNGYKFFRGYWAGVYKTDKRGWEVEVGQEKLTKEEVELGFSEEDLLIGGKPALVFVP